MLFFKNIINNLEILYDKINILRTKEINIPKEFSIIKDYLIRVKNGYEEQLITIYENEK